MRLTYLITLLSYTIGTVSCTTITKCIPNPYNHKHLSLLIHHIDEPNSYFVNDLEFKSNDNITLWKQFTRSIYKEFDIFGDYEIEPVLTNDVDVSQICYSYTITPNRPGFWGQLLNKLINSSNDLTPQLNEVEYAYEPLEISIIKTPWPQVTLRQQFFNLLILIIITLIIGYITNKFYEDKERKQQEIAEERERYEFTAYKTWYDHEIHLKKEKSKVIDDFEIKVKSIVPYKSNDIIVCLITSQPPNESLLSSIIQDFRDQLNPGPLVFSEIPPHESSTSSNQQTSQSQLDQQQQNQTDESDQSQDADEVETQSEDSSESNYDPIEPYPTPINLYSTPTNSTISSIDEFLDFHSTSQFTNSTTTSRSAHAVNQTNQTNHGEQGNRDQGHVWREQGAQNDGYVYGGIAYGEGDHDSVEYFDVEEEYDLDYALYREIEVEVENLDNSYNVNYIEVINYDDTNNAEISRFGDRLRDDDDDTDDDDVDYAPQGYEYDEFDGIFDDDYGNSDRNNIRLENRGFDIGSRTRGLGTRPRIVHEDDDPVDDGIRGDEYYDRIFGVDDYDDESRRRRRRRRQNLNRIEIRFHEQIALADSIYDVTTIDINPQTNNTTANDNDNSLNQRHEIQHIEDIEVGQIEEIEDYDSDYEL